MNGKSTAGCPEGFIAQLSRAFRDNELVLFCGAGISASAGLPLWDLLLERLTYRVLKDDGFDVVEALSKKPLALTPAEGLNPPSSAHAGVISVKAAAHLIHILETDFQSGPHDEAFQKLNWSKAEFMPGMKEWVNTVWIREFLNRLGLTSPLILARHVRPKDPAEFIRIVREQLYRPEHSPTSYTSDEYASRIRQSELIGEIVNLCREGSARVRAIVVYNFDDVLEQALDAAGIKYQVVHPDDTEQGDELLICHPHGYLSLKPEEGETNRALILSEEDYHAEYGSPHSWSNLIQLRFLLSNTCLFAGMSMNDPNLRRLLDLTRKARANDRWHYVIRACSDLPYLDEEALERWRKKEEEFVDAVFRDLGVKTVWVEGFDEIPPVLARITELATD